MLIVSGCPRSGTSLMMDCLRLALGNDRILGEKFPRFRSMGEKHESETGDEFAARQYVFSRANPEADKEMERTRDMNPNGFYECRYTVRGIWWHLGMPNLDNKVCKIVSQGLVNSDPRYIDKVVFMLRHPRQVAKSQERLKRFPFAGTEHEDEIIVHTPEMFIKVSVQAAAWFKELPHIPVQIVRFDDLIARPDETLAKVGEFIGEGDFSKHPIEPKLKRSNPEDIPSHLWIHAEKIHDLMEALDFAGVLAYAKANAAEIHRDDVKTYCTRLNSVMVYNECMNCQSKASKVLVRNFIGMAESQGIDWRREPCMFDCLTNPGVEHVSMAESIRDNHWAKASEV